MGVLRAEALIELVAIIDLDVHQGDGNASLLGGDPGTYILDIYGEEELPVSQGAAATPRPAATPHR